MVQMDLRAVQNRAFGASQTPEPHIQHPRGPGAAGSYRRVPPSDLRFLQICQVEGRPLTGVGGVHAFTVDLQGPHPALQPGGDQFHSVPHPDSPFSKGAGDYGAEAVHGKDPVNGKPEGCQRAFFPRLLYQAVQGVPQFRDSLTGDGGDWQNGRAL